MEKPYHNSNLFSKHYLDNLLPREKEWKVETSFCLEKINALYEANKMELPSLNEGQLRKHFLDKVLEILGWTLDVEPPTPSGEGVKHPDYGLFKDEESLKSAQSSKEGYFSKTTCIAEIKRWGRPLDRRLKSEQDLFEIQNPSLQMSRYLWLAGVQWGVLTDGRYWRLYERETSKRLDIYYEIDLPSLLEEGTEEDFKYFCLFFRKESFPEFVHKVYEGSINYAKAVGKELKGNVYQAMKILAEGFLKTPGNDLSPENLKDIHDNSLILLYRLLFVLYAEYRDLLPLGKNQFYTGSYSLHALKKEIASKLDRRDRIALSGPQYWDTLKRLFEIINSGNPELEVPLYNGGLFNPTKHPFLERYRAGDLYIAKAIDLLTRTQDKAFIDYSSLEVRHLGSIYEGLLEYKLRIADQNLVSVKEKGKEIYVPLDEAREKGKKIKEAEIVQIGEVYLVTDKGERKASGSYYTPDYIVKYIVENTLSPLIKGKRDKVKAQVERLKPKLKSLRQEITGLKTQLTKSTSSFQGKLYESKIKQKEAELQRIEAEVSPDSLLIDEILSIKLLDPAMGSGHFLVEATDFLAHTLLRALEGSLYQDTGEKTLIKEDHAPYQIAQDFKHEEEDIRWARREVVGKCIYGVDLNPLAVELAKLSLWLSTVAKSRPLNFLDHHLRCGNSLIGAKVEDLANLPDLRKKRKIKKCSDRFAWNYFESIFKERVSLLLGDFALIESLSSDTVENIGEKEKHYRNFRSRVAKFQDVADVWTSVYFGNEIDWKDYDQLQESLRAKEEEWQTMITSNISFKQAKEIARDKHFFHWELEFPEIFFEESRYKDSPGFDCVVGNPPWLMAGYHLSDTIDYFQKKYESAQGKFDLYYSFIEQGNHLISGNGLFGMIVPNKFFHTKAALKLRSLLSEQKSIREILDFGDAQVFTEATNYSCILFLQKQAKGNPRYIRAKEDLIIIQQFVIPWSEFTSHSWCFTAQRNREIFEKMEEIGESLEQLVQRFGTGVQSGADRLLIIDANTAATQGLEMVLLSPVFKGRDIQRYRVSPKPDLLIFPYKMEEERFAIFSEEELQEYSNVYSLLLENKQELARRIWFGRTAEELSGRWYSMMHLDSRCSFVTPHILTPSLSNFPNFSLGTGDLFVTGTAGVTSIVPKTEITEDILYLLSVLNSNLIGFYITNHSPIFSGGYHKFSKPYLKQLPIRRINFTTPEPERERSANDLIAQHKAAQSDQILTQIEEYLPKDKDGNFITDQEKSDVIHDFLAFLAEQMIEMNKEKQAEIKNFFSWLKDVHNIDKDALKPKTYLNKFYELESGDLFNHLEKNKIKPNPTDYSQIKNAFEESVNKLRPLIQRIETTDRLIDQIVYKLYGLIEEEIRIVEGSR